MIVTCASCQKQLSVNATLAGKQVKCPGCGHIFAVSRPVAAAAGSAGNCTLPADSQSARPAPPIAPNNPPTHSGSYVLENTAAEANKPDSGHDPSLTEFLSPAQTGDELGRLGKYRILKILGHGGMGVVYQAEDPMLKRTVALKAILPGLATSATAGKRFLREAQSLAQVEHDHIVRIHEVNEERGVPFLAMEFLKGEPLDVRLQRENKLPILEVVRIGKEIAEGLQAAHERGLIHRDIKPGNIWLEGPRSRVKILDFGLARSIEQESGLTQQGAILGTPAYMAPEQARGDAVDARADLFSLGVVLYRLCSGKQPFQGKDAISILMAVATDRPSPLGQLTAEVPAELSNLVMQLLQKDPEHRPATAAIVVEKLQALEQKLRPEPTTSLSSAPKAPPRKRRLGVAIAAGLLGIAIFGAGIVIIIRNRKGEETARIHVPDDSRIEIVGDAAKASPPSVQQGHSFPSLDPAWVKAVAAMAPEKQVAAVHAELKKRNGGYPDNFNYKIEKGYVVEVVFNAASHLTDLMPLRALPQLSRLNCVSWPAHGDLKDLSPLTGIELTSLIFRNNHISDLSPLKGMPLVKLDCWDNPVSDLTPLEGMPLEELNLNGTGIQSLFLLRGMKLRSLSFQDCSKISDLAPLEGMPLDQLNLSGTGVESLSPLRGMRLKSFQCRGCSKLSDLSPLEGMPIEFLNCERAVALKSLAPLKGMKLKEFSCRFCPHVGDLSPLAEMPLERLYCDGTQITNLMQLRGLKLKRLSCESTRISDLSPLAGMPLERLSCNDTMISSLAPLKGMALQVLDCHSTKVSDLSPLAGMPLVEILCDFVPERDAALLRSIKTLKSINLKPAQQFWKEMDAKSANKKP